MKRTAKIFLSFFIFLISVLLVAPFFINISDYKKDIEDVASKALSRSVKVDEISLRLLPSPVVSLKKLSISNAPGGLKKNFIEIDGVRVHINILSLIKRKVKLTNVAIDGPKIYIENINGVGNWKLDQAHDMNNFTSAIKEEIKSTTQSSNKFEIDIDHIDLIKGQVIYLSGSRPIELDDITATVRLNDSLAPIVSFGYFKVSGFDVRFDLNAQDIGSEEIPFKLTMDTVGLECSLDGAFSVSSKRFKGHAAFEAQSDLMKKAVNNYPYVNDLIKEFLRGKAYVSVSESGLSLKEIEIAFDDQVVTGLAYLDFKAMRADVDLRGFVGGTSVNLSSNISNAGYSGKFQLDSSNPKKFLAWLNLNDFKIRDDLSSKLNLSSEFKYDPNSISLNKMFIGYKQAKIGGSLVYNIPSSKISCHMVLDNGDKILHYAGLNKASGVPRVHLITDVSLKNNIAGKALLSVGSLEIGLDGHFYPNQKLIVHLRSKSLNELLKSVFDSSSSIKACDIRTALTGDGSGVFNLNNLLLSLGFSQGVLPVFANLKIDTRLSAQISGDVHIKSLNSKLLLAESANEYLDDAYEVMLASYSPGKSIKHPNKSPRSSASIERWSKSHFDLSFLRQIGLDMGVKIDNLSHENYQINNITGSIKIKDGILSANKMKASCFGGDVALDFAVSGDVKTTMKMLLAINNAKLKNIFSDNAGAIRITDGSVDLLLDVNSTGKSVFSIVNAIKGKLALKATNGALQGFDLRSVSNKLKNTRNISSVLELLTASFNKGITKFDSLDCLVEFDKGIGNIKKCDLIADGGKGNASGSINLPLYSLDVIGTFTIDDLQDFPPLKVRLYGPLDNIQKSFDTKALESYMIKNVFNVIARGTGLDNALGGVLGKIIGNTPSGEKSGGESSKGNSASSSAQSHSNDSSATEANPKKIIENVLKGLF